MKDNVKLLPVFFLTIILGLGACKKGPTIAPDLVTVPQPIQPTEQQEDSLPGKEYIMNGLLWEYDVDGGGNLYIGIENRPDLFGMGNAVAKVHIY
ncbi:MAG TPA: hypothetical protein VNS32_01105, partial [Flavisolibacter sp.]|nr:hypothetical protein [Flavisolibacter sp.]